MVPMVNSFRKQHPEGLVNLVLVNCQPLAQHWENSCIVYENAARDKEDQLAYVANKRVSQLYSVLHAIPDGQHVIYLDADSIVRKPIQRPGADVSALSRPYEGTEDMKYLVSTVRFISGRGARAFCHYWLRETERLMEKEKSIMSCQTAFHRVLEMRPTFCTFTPAPASLSDWTFNDDSEVWCAKGNRKEHPRFLEAMAGHG